MSYHGSLYAFAKHIYIVTSSSNFNCIVCLFVLSVCVLREVRAWREFSELPRVIIVTIAPRAPVGVNKSYAFLNTKAHFDINIEASIHNFRVLL